MKAQKKEIKPYQVDTGSIKLSDEEKATFAYIERLDKEADVEGKARIFINKLKQLEKIRQPEIVGSSISVKITL